MTDDSGERSNGRPSSNVIGLSELTVRAQIRDVAMKKFAAKGVEATSLKQIAEETGRSVGLVQHYFGTKAHLVEVINEHALQMMRRFLGEPSGGAPTDDPLDDLGERFTAFAAEHTDIVDYMCHALIHGDELGAAVFDALYEISESHYRMLKQRDMVRPDLDVVPATILPVLMRISVFLLRPQIERKLGTPLPSPEGLGRMNAATTMIIRYGLLREGLSSDAAENS